MDTFRNFKMPPRFPVYVILNLFLLAGLAIIVPVSAETIGAGISAGPAKVCPGTGCICMPESQAESLGYVRCSGNATPCFQDSFGRPLYCYRPQNSSCRPSSCNVTDSEGSVPPGTPGINLVITMQTIAVGNSSCISVSGDACTIPQTSETVTATVPADPFTAIITFFRSVFGLK